MPRVPTVDGPSAEAAPLPGARYAASPAAGAGALQQAGRLNEVAQAAQQWAVQRQNQDDINAAWRAETALKDSYLQFEQDELGKQGVNASGATQRAQQWWQQNTQKFAEGLTERQQYAYLRNVTALRQSSADALMRHERVQSNVAMAESAQARVGSAINMAVGDPTNQERLANSRREIVEAVNITGALAGMPEEAKAAKLQEMLSLMHRGVVMQLADTDPDAAKAYYYGNKKEMTASVALDLEKVVERSGRLQKAQTAADDIMGRGMSLPDAMSYIEKTYSGEDEVAIKNEVSHRWTVQKQGEADIVTKAYGRALLSVAQGRRVASEDWSAMDPTHQAAILERQRAEQKRAAAEAEGKAVRTDFATYDALNRMSWQRPQDFQGLDLNRYADKISRADLERFSDRQREVANAEGVKGLATREQQIATTINQLQLSGEKNAEKRGLLNRSINDALEEETRRQGRPLKYGEIQQVIDSQVMEMTVHRDWWFDSTKRAYELTPEERGRATVKVPDADRALIMEALRKHGKPVTEQAIADLYAKRKASQ